MAYTFQDVLSEMERTGAKLSKADLELAQKHPEVGLSLLSLGRDWNNATTEEGRILAHTAAEELRKSYGGYSGGADGAGYQVTSKPESTASGLLDEIRDYGSFSYDKKAPTYTDAYAEQRKQLLEQVADREDFEWSKEDDPVWGSYKKSYLREGDRAMANALAQAAAATGGVPSSYAVTAAGQAGDYYASKLNDMIPALEETAYQRYLNEQAADLQRLDAINAQEQTEYQRYLNALTQHDSDRDFAYRQHLDGLNVLGAKLEAARESESGADREQAREEVDAILSLGGTPSAQLVVESGYSNEYIKALQDAWAAEHAQTEQTVVGSPQSGGRGYDNGSLTAEQVKTLQSLLGVETDGFYGPATRAAAGGISADEAWVELVGGEGKPVEKQPSSGYNSVKATLDRAPGLTQLNKVDIIEDAYNHGRLTDNEVNQLLDHIGYGEV